MAIVSVRFEDELRDQVAQEAELKGVTVSKYIRDALANQMRFEEAEGLEIGRPDDSAENLELSPFQRRILVQLHRAVLAAKGHLSDSYYDPKEEVRGINVLEHGFVGDYSQEFAGIESPMSQAECELVWDVFDMFRIIGASVRSLDGGWDQLGIDERYGTFRGFDGNHALEGRMLDYARYLVKNDRWEEQACFIFGDARGNSHSQMVPTYRAMLRVFKPLWSQTVKGGTRWHLSEEQVRQVMEAVPGVQATTA